MVLQSTLCQFTGNLYFVKGPQAVENAGLKRLLKILTNKPFKIYSIKFKICNKFGRKRTSPRILKFDRRGVIFLVINENRGASAHSAAQEGDELSTGTDSGGGEPAAAVQLHRLRHSGRTVHLASSRRQPASPLPKLKKLLAQSSYMVYNGTCETAEAYKGRTWRGPTPHVPMQETRPPTQQLRAVFILPDYPLNCKSEMGMCV